MEEAVENNDVVIEQVQPIESETNARRLGWVPKEEWKGPEDKWRDADEFLQRGEEIHGYLKEDLKKLQTSLTQKDREILEIKQTMEEFRKFHNETEARAYKRAIEDLKQAKVEAIERGEGARVVEIDDQIEQIKEAQKSNVDKTTAKTADAVNQEYLNWLPENKWYGNDPELTQLAEDFGEIIKKQNPSLIGKEFLDEVTKRVKRTAPEKFENPARNNPTVSSSSDGRVPASNKKKQSYDTLPAEAKAACDKFVKQGLITKEQYVAEYFANE